MNVFSWFVLLHQSSVHVHVSFFCTRTLNRAARFWWNLPIKKKNQSYLNSSANAHHMLIQLQLDVRFYVLNSALKSRSGELKGDFAEAGDVSHVWDHEKTLSIKLSHLRHETLWWMWLKMTALTLRLTSQERRSKKFCCYRICGQTARGGCGRSGFTSIKYWTWTSYVPGCEGTSQDVGIQPSSSFDDGGVVCIRHNMVVVMTRFLVTLPVIDLPHPDWSCSVVCFLQFASCFWTFQCFWILGLVTWCWTDHLVLNLFSSHTL